MGDSFLGRYPSECTGEIIWAAISGMEELSGNLNETGNFIGAKKVWKK